MPVKFNFADDLTPKDIDAAKQAISKMQDSGRYQDILTDPDVVVNMTRNVEDGAQGTYIPSTNELKIAPQRARGNVDELIDTIRHEIHHSMQSQSPGYGTVGNYTRRDMPYKLMNAASKEGLFYGDKEFEAFVASNLRPGIPATNERITKLQKQFPGELEKLYSKTAQPMREPVDHKKHEAEWTPTEKVLNTIFGYQPSLNPND